MGIINVTPDSFSDGGRFLAHDAAIAHGLAMAAVGADLVDVGGESTRPGAAGVGAGAEIDRVEPVVRALAERGVLVSIDTSKAEVAAAAIEAGAAVVNDVTALGDADMAGVVAGAGVGLVLMHMKGTPRTMQVDPHYDDVVSEVRDFLVERAATAESAGVASDAICIDPGIGFGKNLDHNLALLADTAALAATGYPVLMGASRKSWITHLLGDMGLDERDLVTTTAHALAIVGGASMIRVHDVVAGLRSARTVDAIVRSSAKGFVR
ncbi:MAG: dihydropteroate synthase [Acidimicrobiia bacterium]|nr:dihydropteroate synthase [Acidimicrobiia bacterium]